MNPKTETLVSALRILSVEIQSGDGVANAVVAEAADRLTLMANLVARHIEETKKDTQEMQTACETMTEATETIQRLKSQIERLEEELINAKGKWAALVADVVLHEDRGERIRLLISERDSARLQADKKISLREEFRELLQTDDIEQGVIVVRGLQERIKRLEMIISRARNVFFRDGSCGRAASGMLEILGEVRKP